MNGYELYKKALTRLGYNSSDNETVFSDSRMIRAKELINQILCDLKQPLIDELSANIKVSVEIAETLCCGLAMLLSLCEGDGTKNQLFTDIYNAKRASVLAEISFIEDTLPRAESGGE